MALNLKPTITKISTTTKRFLIKVPPLIKQVRPVITAHYRRFKRNPRHYLLTHRRQTLIATSLLLLFLFGLINSSLTFLSNLPPQAPPFTTPLVSDYYIHAENQVFSARLGNKDTKSPSVNFRVNNQDITFSLKDANPSKPKKKGQSLIFENVADHLNISYQTLPNGIKEELILTKLPTTNTFHFTLDYSNLNSPKVLNNIKAPVFYDQEGNYLFHFEKPFAYDSAGNRSDDASLIIKIDPDTNKYIAQLSVSQTWLSSPDRVYPVYIDPTIVHDTSSEFSGTMNRTHDAGSGSAPIIENYYLENTTDASTVGLWHMNDISGSTITDSSGQNNNGTATGTTITTGLLDNARSFNGSSDYAVVPNNKSLEPPTSITFESWIKIEGDGSHSDGVYILTKGQHSAQPYFSYSLGYYAASDLIGCNVAIGGTYRQVTSQSTFTSSSPWTHVACTYDGNEIAIYVNGIKENSAWYSGSINYGLNTSNDLRIGDWGYSTYTRRFQGKVDEVRISNTARTPEEIWASAQKKPSSTYTSPVIDLTNATSFNSLSWSGTGIPTGDGETASSSSGLVAQWNFNESSGTTASVATGSCGSTCNGTLTNFSNTSSQDALANSGWTAIHNRWGTGAINLDGTDDYISVTQNASINFNQTSPFTIEAWVKPIGSGYIANKQQNVTNEFVWSLDYNSSTNKFAFSLSKQNVSGLTATSAESFLPGKWYHVVGVSNGTDFYIYVNGRQQASTNISFTGATQSLATLYFGQLYNNTNRLKGTIDTIRIYSRALTAGEILSNYNHTQLQFQTRTSTDSASWEAWKTTSNDTQIYSFDDTTLFNPSQSGLIGYWPFNETSDNSCPGGEDACDATSNSNDGTATGTNIVDGVFGKARRFSSSTINAGNVSPLSFLEYNSNMTFSAWIKTGTDQSGTILSKQESSGNYRGYNLQTGSGGYIYFQLVNIYSTNTLEVRSTNNLNFYDNQWHLVTATYDGSATPAGVKIYFDGIQVATTTTINTLSATIANSSPFHIGSRNGAAQFFNGLIDEVRVFNSVLDSETIKDQYVLGSTNHLSLHPSLDAILKNEGNASLNLTTGKLKVDHATVAYYTLDQTGGSGAYIKDLSYNDNHLTPTGTSSTDGISNKARSFNGTSSDYLSINSNLGLGTSNITIEAWVYINSTSRNGAFVKIGNTGGYGIGIGASTFDTTSQGNDLILLYENVRWIDTNTTLGTGWHHVAMVIDGTGVPSAYKDGVLVGTYGGSNAVSPSSNSYIGGYTTGGYVRYYNGIIDEVRISNVARTATEIAESYRLGRNHKFSLISTSSNNLSTTDHLPISIAADEPGTYLQTSISESSYKDLEPENNTVALYHLEENSPSSSYLVQDSSVYKNHGTPTSITLNQGVIGNSAKFSGSGQINLGNPSSLQITGNQTIEMWIYPTSFALRRNPFAKAYGGEGTITQETNGTLNYYYGTAGGNTTPYQAFNSSAALELNKWTHIALVRDLTNMTLTWYFNGVVVNTATASYTSATASSLNALIGNGYTDYFIGSLDEVRISNVARSAEKIRQSYEAGKRTHSITIDFGASLDSGNLISNSSDTSFTIDATTKGLSQKGANLYTGDTIIIKENYDGTEYIAQGEVASINTSNGAVTVSSWQSGSTFPASGFTANATVFKWQTEYINISNIPDQDRDTIYNIGLKITDGNQGRSIWIDNLRKSSGYYTNNLSTSIDSTPNRYFQYRAILTSADSQVTPTLNSVTLDYVQNYTPNQPSLEAAYLHDNLYTPDSTPTIRFSATDDDNDDINYQVQIYTDADFSSPTSYTSGTDSGFANITTPADTAPFNEGDTISFTFPTLTSGTTYFYRVRAIDPSGTNSYGDWSTTKSFTINTSLTNNAWHQTHADQFSSDTASLFINISDVGNSVTINNPLIYRTVTINNSGSQQSNYDALIELDTASLISAGKMQSDCDDIRFWTDDTLTTNLNYYLESGCNTSTTQIWVRIPTLNSGDNIIYLSYNDASATSGSQTWTGANAIIPRTTSCPVGSTRFSTLDNLYPRGNSTYGGSYDGQHRHLISGTTSTHNPTGQILSGSDYYVTWVGSHSHTYSFDSGYNAPTPNYVETIFCSYDSLPNLISTDDIVIFETLPLGWTRNTTYDNRFMKGAISYGTTGGGPHSHTMSGTTSTKSADGGIVGIYPYASYIWPAPGHSHSINGSTGSSDPLPPYRTQIFASPDTSVSIPPTSIIMTNGSTLPPYGWIRFTSLDGYFPYGSSSSGTTGGSTTHTHTFSFTTGSSGSQSGVGSSGTSNHASAHTHTGSGTSGAGSNLPPYLDMVFIQKKSDPTTKTFGNETTNTQTLISTKITGAQIHDANWHQLTFTDDETNGSIYYQILYDNSGTPTLIPDGILSGNSTGFTTSPVNLSSISKTTYPELYIKANFTYSGGAPILYDWTVTTNDPPNTPTLDSPASGSKQVTILPTLKTTTTDPESDYLHYKIQLCTNEAMTENCQTFDQTSSQTGWSGQDTQSNTAYASGTQASYTLQTALSHNQTYYWRSYAIDPGGSNTWSTTQTYPSYFTTIHVVPPSECVAEVAPDFSSIIIRWVDNTLNENSFELEKKINSGAFTNIQTTLPDITSYQDSTVSATNTYQYRVRTIINSDPSVWCTTAVLNLGTGSFQFEGLQLEGLQVH